MALIAPRDASGAIALPDDATRIELRLSRVSADDECPSVADAAAGRVRGELAHAQSFAIAEGMGRSIGELPDGQWTLTATGRTEACEVRLYGCVLFETARLGDEVEVPLVLADSAETCGCRACESGACSPEGRACP